MCPMKGKGVTELTHQTDTALSRRVPPNQSYTEAASPRSGAANGSQAALGT